MDIEKILGGPFNLDIFRAAIKEYHPDKCGSDTIYKKLVEWRDGAECCEIHVIGNYSSFQLGQPKYQGHTSRIFEVDSKSKLFTLLSNAYCEKYLKTPPDDCKFFIKVIKDKKLKSFLDEEASFLSNNIYTVQYVNGVRLTGDPFKACTGYAFLSESCVTIKDIKEKVGTVEDHHIAWMYKRILESLDVFLSYGRFVYAPIPEHIAFRPKNHGIYHLGLISMFSGMVPTSCPKPKKLCQHYLDIKIATDSLLEITGDGPFRNFLVNIGDIPHMKNAANLLKEFDEFAARLIPKKFYEFKI